MKAYQGIRIHTVDETVSSQDSSVAVSLGWYVVEGRVEVRKDGYWGTICSNEVYTGIDDLAAGVMCNNLGYFNGDLFE